MIRAVVTLTAMLLAAPGWAAAARQPEPTAGSAGDVRLRLADDVITGSSERPKVLYILPWRSAASTPGLDAPPDPELTELFDPLDPDAHSRETDYRARAATVADGAGVDQP